MRVEEDFRINKEEVDYSENSIGYTIGNSLSDGVKECEPEDNKCFAKQVSYSTMKQNFAQDKMVPAEGIKYYVMFNVNETIFDPWSHQNNQYFLANRKGKDANFFKEVNKKCFEFYVKFLTTRNQAWKIKAEREYRS